MYYAASCNPPRRAKRQRTGSLGDGPSSPTVPTTAAPASPHQQRRAAAANARPPILPKQPAHGFAAPASPDSDSASDGGEDDYAPGRDAAPAPKRRGRKPGAMSRSARESLRKLNHSRIEKARRTKINETLATLSTLVGERDRVLAPAPVDAAAAPPEQVEDAEKEKGGRKGKGKSEGEKEFKLDVLVKTVEYMQDLVARVQALEEAMCAPCRARDDASAAAHAASATRASSQAIDVDVDEPMQDQEQEQDLVPPSPKDRKSTRLNSSHSGESRMPSSA